MYLFRRNCTPNFSKDESNGLHISVVRQKTGPGIPSELRSGNSSCFSCFYTSMTSFQAPLKMYGAHALPYFLEFPIVKSELALAGECGCYSSLWWKFAGTFDVSTCGVHRAWYGWCHPRQFHFPVQGDSRSYNYVAALSSDDEPLWEEIMILAKLIPRVCHNINRWATLAVRLFLVSPPQVCFAPWPFERPSYEECETSSSLYSILVPW